MHPTPLHKRMVDKASKHRSAIRCRHCSLLEIFYREWWKGIPALQAVASVGCISEAPYTLLFDCGCWWMTADALSTLHCLTLPRWSMGAREPPLPKGIFTIFGFGGVHQNRVLITFQRVGKMPCESRVQFQFHGRHFTHPTGLLSYPN